jgi:DNA polymerase III gamma/tau subunit
MTETLSPKEEESNQELSTAEPNQTSVTRKLNAEALKSYQKYQQKYMDVFGRLQVRKNPTKRWKLQARLKTLQEKLKRIEAFLYED